MAHKLRDVMGKRDSHYRLKGGGEWRWTKASSPPRHLKTRRTVRSNGGRGSQRKTSVLVMAESSRPKTTTVKKHYSTSKAVGHIKMQVIDDFKASTLISKISQGTDGNATVTTDGYSSYASMEKDGAAASHQTVVVDDKKNVGKVLPWVHIAISNAKRSILDTYMT